MANHSTFDILTISETWFNSSVSDAYVTIDGFNLFRLNRHGKVGGGGGGEYVRSNLKTKTQNKKLTRSLTRVGTSEVFVLAHVVPRILAAMLAAR